MTQQNELIAQKPKLMRCILAFAGLQTEEEFTECCLSATTVEAFIQMRHIAVQLQVFSDDEPSPLLAALAMHRQQRQRRQQRQQR